MSTALSRWLGWALGAALIALLVDARPAAAQAAANTGGNAVQALQVVDCLLPGQVRVVGGRTYLTPRRPTRSTGADCAARGGEYLAYDRADYRAALDVWLPSAEQGDAEAQTRVGEIYEHGLRGEPDYAAAAEWYRRAAEHGNTRAQFDLGTLYEQGLGVGTDKLEALNWYRRASGLAADNLIFQSAAAAEQQAQRAALLEQIEQRDRQLEILKQQVEDLNRRLREASDDTRIRAQLDSLRALVAQVDGERRAVQEAVDKLPGTVRSKQTTSDAVSFARPKQVTYRRSDFGRFYALLIGVQDYTLLDNLTSPANDVSRIGALLAERYGFSVISLADPDQLAVMRAINELSRTVDKNDNVLIYFSGHGSRLQSGSREAGYWLPANAEPSPNDTLWVPNDFVTRHLGMLNARRVLVIADSCYAGLLGDEPGFVMVGEGNYSDAYVQWKLPKRSRLVISSGGDSPEVENLDAMHSVFARALVEALDTNEQLLTAPELFLKTRNQIRRTAPSAHAPEFKALKDAGHEVGDFFFVPTSG